MQQMTQAKRKIPQGLGGHPQLQKIIDAILAGQSCREIAAWTRPRVSRATINRFGRDTVAPTMQQAKSILPSVAPMMKENEVLASPQEQENRLRQVTRDTIISAPILASRQNRLAAIQDRHDRMMMIVEDRADDMQEVPGGRSGFLVRDYKGKDASAEVYKFDAALAGEMREHERHMAIELGQWQEAPPPQVAIQIVMPTTQSASDPASAAPVIDIALPLRPNR